MNLYAKGIDHATHVSDVLTRSRLISVGSYWNEVVLIKSSWVLKSVRSSMR